jgi:hypothetical protein
MQAILMVGGGLTLMAMSKFLLGRALNLGV